MLMSLPFGIAKNEYQITKKTCCDFQIEKQHTTVPTFLLGNDQLDALFLDAFIFMPLHVSSSKCSSSGGPNCINTSSGITHSGE
jgi:hypothetical protein